MILKQPQNTPVTAPQMADMADALSRYRNWMNDQNLVMADFLKFITQPSALRDEFLALFTPAVTVRDNMYVKVMYA